jgi:bisanhydrobacterioruberin hydratase
MMRLRKIKFSNITMQLNRNSRIVSLIVYIFYAVGIAGILHPSTFSYFTGLIPFVILSSLVLLLLYHNGTSGLKLSYIFSFIFTVGFFIEVAGVNTGIIFGNYQYGHSLGFKVFNTPVIIGLNWVLLIYLSASILQKTNLHSAIKVFLSSLIMVFYDLFLEQVAPIMDMWRWENNEIPLQNYFAWFVISLFFHALVNTFKMKLDNKIAPALLISQLLFFIILSIFLGN